MRSFNPLGNVLESVLTGLEMGSRTREYLALILWPDVVGEQIARITAVQSVRDGVLYVDVESSVWAQELQYYIPDLIARVNQNAGPDVVKDIRFRTRAVLTRPYSRGENPTGRARGRKKPIPEVQLTLEECHEIRETCLRVSDPVLREALTSTISSYRHLQRNLEAQGWKRCIKCRAVHKRRRGCPFCTLP